MMQAASPQRDGARLVPSHREVMEVLWAASEPKSIREIGAEVGSRYPERAQRAYSTTATVVTQLEELGYVASRKRGRRHVYSPEVGRDELLSRVARATLSSFCDRPWDGLFLLREVLAGIDLADVIRAGELVAARRVASEARGDPGPRAGLGRTGSPGVGGSAP